MAVRLEGDVSKFKAQLKRLEELDLKKVNASVAELLRTSTMERFKTGKSPEGVRWEPSQRVRDIGGVTLTDTATLKKSIRAKSDGSMAAVGTNLKYAATHQFGDNRIIRAKNSGGLHFQIGGRWVTVKAVRVSIPARPFLGISDDDMKEIEGTIEDAIMEE